MMSSFIISELVLYKRSIQKVHTLWGLVGGEGQSICAMVCYTNRPTHLSENNCMPVLNTFELQKTLYLLEMILKCSL